MSILQRTPLFFYIGYNRMEIYNQLFREFHDSQTHPQLLQLKSISDELFRTRAAKKMLYLNKKQQLRQIQKGQEMDLSHSRLPVSLRSSTARSSVRSLDVSRQDLVSIDREELKKKIRQLEQGIAVLRDKTQEVNGELSLFSKKQSEIEIVGKSSELSVFNSVQTLYLQASRQNQEQLKERHLLSQLQHRRQTLTNQISQLCQSMKNSENLHRRWQQSKAHKIQPSKCLGAPYANFKQITLTMLKLKNLMQQSRQDCGKPSQKEDNLIVAIQQKTSKLSIISQLALSNLKMNGKFAEEVIEFYKTLENEFDRNERANKQINSYLQTLNVKNDELGEILQKNDRHTQKRTKQSLKKTEFSLKELEERLNSQCRLITNFTNKFYFLLTRMQSLKTTVKDILMRNAQKTQEMGEVEEGENVLLSYDQKLNKNLEDFMIRWFDSFGPHSTFYQQYIEPNDMLRLFACPQSYNSGVDDLTNYEMFMISCFRCVHDYSKKMSKEVNSFFIFCKCSFKNSSKNIEKLEDNQFCVESMDYYRRDNYKLLQKIKKNELKKKGLLAQIPFNVCIDTELIQRGKDRRLMETVSTPRMTERNRRYMKYTEMASKREERSMKSNVFRKLFNRLGSLRSQSSSRLLNLSSLADSRTALNTSKEWPGKSIKRITLPRNTVGTLHKQNSQYY